MSPELVQVNPRNVIELLNHNLQTFVDKYGERPRKLVISWKVWRALLDWIEDYNRNHPDWQTLVIEKEDGVTQILGIDVDVLSGVLPDMIYFTAE